MSYGFVYLLGNVLMPGIYKIGFSMRHPRERLNELSKATACPVPFDLISFFDCEDPENAEKEIHEILSKFRVNELREFFNAPLHVIRDCFRGFADTVDGVFLSDYLDLRSNIELDMKGKKFLVDHFLSQNIDHTFLNPVKRGFTDDY